MSIEKAREFAEKVDKDKALREKLKAATEHIMTIAKEHGYEFTRAELHDVMKAKWGAAKMPSARDTDEPAIFFSGRPRF